MKKIFSLAIAMLAVTSVAFAESKQVDCGSSVTIQAKAAEGYHFVEWNDHNTQNPRTIENVSASQTFTAYFDINTYTIRFFSDEQKQNQVGQTQYVNHGQTPTAPAAPTKPATAQYTYTFAGWSPVINAATQDQDYIAQFTETINKYQIRFLNWDGAELSSNLVNYGETPAAPAQNPTKPATAQYTYTFLGWSPAIAAVTGAADYTAQYDSTVNEYSVTFKNYNGDVLYYNPGVAYGTNLASLAPTDVERDNEGCTEYIFDGWGIDANAIVTGNVVYTATYTAQTIKYTITIESEDANKGGVSFVNE